MYGMDIRTGAKSFPKDIGNKILYRTGTGIVQSYDVVTFFLLTQFVFQKGEHSVCKVRTVRDCDIFH